MNNPIPKRHHYLPEMLQKRFADKNGALWFFDKNRPERGIIASKPGNIFVEGHLYSIVEADGSKDVSVEVFYSRIESLADPIVERIVLAAREGRNPDLSPEEFSIWCHFFYYQQKRVPDFYSKLEDLQKFPQRLEEAIAEYEAEFGRIPAEIRERFNAPNEIERMRKNAIVRSLATPGEMILDVLHSRGIVIAIPKQKSKSFLLGSYPTARLGTRNGSSLDNPEVELWLPIASDVAISPFGAPGEFKIVFLDDQHVRHVNKEIFRRSTMAASRSKALIGSLCDQR